MEGRRGEREGNGHEQQQGWGLSMYEQDWMCKEYDETAALQANISLADDWLRQRSNEVL